MTRRFRYKDIQLPQLRSFCQAATQGNFTAAAKALGLSAPTVWEQVRGLERQLGATLLLRRGRLVELTPEGQLLLNLIQPHVSGFDSLQRLFDAQRAELPQRLIVASTPNLLAYHLVVPVQEFTAAHPSVYLQLRPSVKLEDVVRLMERGLADVAVMSYVPEEPQSQHLQFEPLFAMRLMLLTARNHSLARKKQVTVQDLVQYPLIMGQEGTSSRLALERLLRRHQLLERVHPVLESSHAEVIRTYVAAGIGIAVMYTGEDTSRSLPGLHQRLLDPDSPTLPVALVTRKGAHLSEPVQEFQRIVRRCLAAV